jgi:hypothetical protein
MSEKYGWKEFNDPVLRCDSCKEIVTREKITKTGKCDCGTRKFRELRSMTPEEKKTLQMNGIDHEFLNQFQVVDPKEEERKIAEAKAAAELSRSH